MQDLKSIRCALRNEQLEAAMNAELSASIEQPLASLVLGSYTCSVEADGTEVLSNGNVTVRVPPSCVHWHVNRVRPTGPLSMCPVRQQVLQLVCAVLGGNPRPSHVSREADEMLQCMLSDPHN